VPTAAPAPSPEPPRAPEARRAVVIRRIVRRIVVHEEPDRGAVPVRYVVVPAAGGAPPVTSTRGS